MKPLRSKRLRNAARDQPCVECGRNVEGETVLAHLPLHSAGLGGLGIKAPDFLAAHLCAEHHRFADQGEGRIDYRWRFKMLALTLERLFAQGVIEVKGGP